MCCAYALQKKLFRSMCCAYALQKKLFRTPATTRPRPPVITITRNAERNYQKAELFTCCFCFWYLRGLARFLIQQKNAASTDTAPIDASAATTASLLPGGVAITSGGRGTDGTFATQHNTSVSSFCSKRASVQLPEMPTLNKDTFEPKYTAFLDGWSPTLSANPLSIWLGELLVESGMNSHC